MTFQNEFPTTLQIIIPRQLALPLRLFAQDESRFGLLPVIRRRITLKGIKPIQPTQHVFENYYLYGVVEPSSGDAFFLEMPFLDSQCFQIYLNEFSGWAKKSFNIMVLDNGSFHKAKGLIIPENVALLFLPAYSPELNPIERLWEYIKDQIAGELFQNLDRLKDEVAEVIRRLSKKTVASLTGYPYILQAVNAL
ncbi:MAG: DDE endonuclease [Candidatus Brocadia sp. WS118]|nr:MAG: DDE endonuclease [Candidatus Brocadia sp. WS118]